MEMLSVESCITNQTCSPPGLQGGGKKISISLGERQVSAVKVYKQLNCTCTRTVLAQVQCSSLHMWGVTLL